MGIIEIIEDNIEKGKSIISNMLENRREGAFKDAWKRGITEYGIRVGRGEKMVYDHMFRILDGQFENKAFAELVEEYLDTKVGEDVQDLAKWYFDHDKFFRDSIDFTGLLKMTRRGLHIHIRNYLQVQYSLTIPLDENLGYGKLKKMRDAGVFGSLKHSK